MTASPSPRPTPQPSPPSPSPVASPTPADPGQVPMAEVKEESNGSWTIEWRPGALGATFGSGVPFRATIRHASPVPAASFSFGGAWVDTGTYYSELREPETRIEGVLFAGGFPFDAHIFEEEAQRGYGFEGPDVTVVGSERSIAFVSHTEVSDDPPGLSVEVVGREVRVTYAARENATTTADERVSADNLVLVRDGGAWSLVAFVTKFHNDAVAPLDEPERTRVVAQMPDVPPGPLTVRIVSRVSCFCFPLPSPVVEERVVDVR